MKVILSFCFFFVFTAMSAQKEFWGLINTGGSASTNFGNIFKTDFMGANAEIVHMFNSDEGKRPYGRLFLASNGKLYGTAFQGGATLPNPSNTGGVLFEYDLIFNRFNVVSYFGSGDLSSMINPKSGVVEVNGKLYGTARGVGIYEHDLTAQTTEVSALVTVSYNGSNAFANSITGELMTASNGLLYGTTQYYSSCPALTPLLGSIVKFNPENNAFDYIYPFNCTYYDGASPTGSLVEGIEGKLYGTTQHGGDFGYENGGIGDGVLFEYDIATNTYTKKIDFDHATTGAFPGPLAIGPDNKLYGVLEAHGHDPNDPDPNNVVNGSIYKYDPDTESVTILYYFSDSSPNIFPAGYNPRGALLKASNGIFYGRNVIGIFRFDPVQATVIPEFSNLEYFYPNESGDLIEICRKPSYTYIENDSFIVCTETDFNFDIQNTNADSYNWIKDGVPLPFQNSGILTLNDLTIEHSGVYTCEMINECGTTVTMPVNLTVEGCMGLDEAVGSKDAIKLYPNPATDILNIYFPERSDFKVFKVTIINTLGQIVYEDSKEYTNINVNHLSKGLYIIKLITDKGDWSGKFIKN